MRFHLLLLFAGVFATAGIAQANPSSGSGYAGTGVTKETLEELCRMANMLKATQGKSVKFVIDTTMAGRYAAGNSTASEYKRQLSWAKSNCPGY